MRCECIELDLSNPEALPRLLDAVEERLGAPSILVNNACYSVGGGFESLDAAVLDAHYAVNVRATTLLSVEFANRFAKGAGGRIINMTTGQAQAPMVGEIAYASTKAAVESLTRILAAEVAHKGITVNAVDPVQTDTGWELMSKCRKPCCRAFRWGGWGNRVMPHAWCAFWPAKKQNG